MTKFVIAVLVGALKDKDVQDFLIRAAREIVEGAIAEKVLPVFPFALGSAVKQFSQIIPGVDSIQDAMETANTIREDMNQLIPDFDTGFKPLDDLLDIWRPKHG